MRRATHLALHGDYCLPRSFFCDHLARDGWSSSSFYSSQRSPCRDPLIEDRNHLCSSTIHLGSTREKTKKQVLLMFFTCLLLLSLPRLKRNGRIWNKMQEWRIKRGRRSRSRTFQRSKDGNFKVFKMFALLPARSETRRIRPAAVQSDPRESGLRFLLNNKEVSSFHCGKIFVDAGVLDGNSSVVLMQTIAARTIQRACRMKSARLQLQMRRASSYSNAPLHFLRRLSLFYHLRPAPLPSRPLPHSMLRT